MSSLFFRPEIDYDPCKESPTGLVQVDSDYAQMTGFDDWEARGNTHLADRIAEHLCGGSKEDNQTSLTESLEPPESFLDAECPLPLSGHEGPGDPVFDAFVEMLRTPGEGNEDGSKTGLSGDDGQNPLQILSDKQALPLDEFLPEGRPFRELTDDEIHLLGPDDQERYFKYEEAERLYQDSLGLGEFEYLEPQELERLSPEDKQAYEEAEEDHLRTFWSERERRRAGDLGDRQAHPEDAAWYYDE